MVKKTKTQTIELLKAEINVRDKLLGGILHECAKKKINLPPHLMSVIEILYINKGKRNGNSKTETESETESEKDESKPRTIHP